MPFKNAGNVDHVPCTDGMLEYDGLRLMEVKPWLSGVGSLHSLDSETCTGKATEGLCRSNH